MKISIEQEVLKRHPDLIIGVAVLYGVKNDASNEAIAKLLVNEVVSATDSLLKQCVGAKPYVASLISTYKQTAPGLGAYLSSFESRAKRVIMGRELPLLDPFFDVHAYMGIKYRLPANSNDTDNAVGAIQLRFADEPLPEVVFIGTDEPEKPEVGKVVYADDQGVMFRRWSYHRAKRTMTDTDTINGVFYFEGLTPIDRETIEQALDEFCALVTDRLGGECKHAILSEELSSVEL